MSNRRWLIVLAVFAVVVVSDEWAHWHWSRLNPGDLYGWTGDTTGVSEGWGLSYAQTGVLSEMRSSFHELTAKESNSTAMTRRMRF